MKKSRHLLDKKEEAHLLIRDLQLAGMKKRIIYLKLSQRLGIAPENCHFAKMNKVHLVEQGISALEQIWHEHKREKRKRRIAHNKRVAEYRKRLYVQAALPKVKERKVLNQKRMRKLTSQVAEMNQRNFIYAGPNYCGETKVFRKYLSKDEARKVEQLHLEHPIISKYFPFLLHFIK